MKKSYLLLVILLFPLFLLSENYFSYDNIQDDLTNETVTVTVNFTTEKNVYIIEKSIHCQTDEYHKGIAQTTDLLGNIYTKENKTSYSVLKKSGIVSCVFNPIKEPLTTISIDFTLLHTDTNKVTQHNELIKIPPYNLKIQNKKEEIKKENLLEEKKDFQINQTSPSFFELLMKKTKGSHFIIIALMTFILGILMSLTPCIYPMIPITISILGIDKKKFSQRLFNGFLYMLGISLTFSILGILAASGKFFFGQLLTLPLFSIITTAVLFFMTLQMLGLTDNIISFGNTITMPNWMQNHRYLPFFYGIFSGTITSPCVSPGLIAILSLVGQQSNILIGWLWLFTFGMGLSLPLFLIALVMNNGFIFPKSGIWMNELKEIIGLTIILILQNNINTLLNPITGLITANIMLIIFLSFKYYTFEKDPASNKYWICSFANTFSLALLIFINYNYYKTQITKNNNQILIHSLSWHTSLEKAKEEAKVNKKLLFLDFTAQWCSICQIIDKEIFTDSNLMNTLNSFYSFCKIDCTQMTAEKELLLKKYKVNGFPSFIIIDPLTGKILKQFSGELLDIKKSTFIQISKDLSTNSHD